MCDAKVCDDKIAIKLVTGMNYKRSENTDIGVDLVSTKKGSQLENDDAIPLVADTKMNWRH